MPSTLKIGEDIFALGEQNLVKFDIADLPSGTKIDLPVHVFRSELDGPVVLICAGMHGDEINGVEIVRRTLVQQFYNNLLRGSAIVMPLINIYGFINFSRQVPDGKDVNRSFPGSRSGSLASQVAYVLSKEIFPKIDYAIDCHTGGSTRYNYPQTKLIDKSFRKQALKQGKSSIVFEGGESLRYDGFSINVAIKGIKKVLQYLEMLPPETDAMPNTSHHFNQHAWQRAEVSGLFVWEKSSGVFVKKGERLATINGPHNTYSIEVKAQRDGFIIGHNNATVINQGDALFHFAWE